MRKTIDHKIRRRVGRFYSRISSELHVGIPLQRIFDILAEEGIVVLQEDNTRWAGLLIGRNAQADFNIAFEETKDPETEMYQPITNSMLRLSWYKLTTKYEVVVYLS